MWNPAQYQQFAGERRQPFNDLLALVQRRPDMRVIDLGCGTGALTRTLHEQLQAAETLGIDSSSDMLETSSEFASEHVRFEQAEIETFTPGEACDLIFSNAALHWVPDHPSLLQGFTAFLNSNGQLAIQMPANDDHPSHMIAAELAADAGIEPRPNYVLPIERYAHLLRRLGFARQHVRTQVYGHLLESSDAVVEWVRGALLTDYERQLPPDEWQQFLRRYRSRIREALGSERPFFYTYKRVLIWASL